MKKIIVITAMIFAASIVKAQRFKVGDTIYLKGVYESTIKADKKPFTRDTKFVVKQQLNQFDVLASPLIDTNYKIRIYMESFDVLTKSEKKKEDAYYKSKEYAQAKANADKQDKDMQAYLKEFDEQWGEFIKYHHVVLGMPDFVVERCVGKPDEINRSIGSWGTHEQWIYKDGFNEGTKDGKTKYLYIENEKLTAIQD